ncbi:type II toxin-antitoxin system CcdA family antitoxin [Pseudomonas citronellolis]|uniref:type II toxin-antitoxin system CcdA family antitoxin n=1 Tax=Pseudomonas citronellolis TaxID=53408 RepID=UPI0020A02106|nr:type II toxin-antitoxin system CcdA family antitoxin [Pseudomonas citronellolis]MCP1607350.1 antitoxin CcdA [Pseudomonas citronellolis]MCP1658189.1 antitoxin CcdA [Pseudomonas citronellolis]MCP1722160.1 antitoxin CcdA [Pseudomonas citronellolis]
MHTTYDPQAPKKATNLSLNSDLLKQARELDVNLSAVLEEALADVVRERLRQRWLEQNRQAIDAYNQHVDSAGVFADDLRSF